MATSQETVGGDMKSEAAYTAKGMHVDRYTHISSSY